MIITSNQVPTAKWDVGGRCVTCISNCALGYNSLNAIDSLGMRTLCCSSAQLSVCVLPSPPSTVWQHEPNQPPRPPPHLCQHLVQSQTSLNRLQYASYMRLRITGCKRSPHSPSLLVHVLNPRVCNWMQLFLRG